MEALLFALRLSFIVRMKSNIQSNQNQRGTESLWRIELQRYSSLLLTSEMSSGGQPQGGRKANSRLPPEVNRVLYVRNLPFKITAEEMYDIFGKYGAIRQIRL